MDEEGLYPVQAGLEVESLEAGRQVRRLLQSSRHEVRVPEEGDWRGWKGGPGGGITHDTW